MWARPGSGWRSLRCGQSSKTIEPLWEAAGQFLTKVHTHLPGDSSFTPAYLLKRNENISHDLYTNVHNSLVHYSPKPETTQMSSCGWGVSKHGLFLQGNITMKKKYTFSTHPTTRWLLKTHWEGGAVHKSVCTLWLHLQQVLKQVTWVLLVLGRAEAAWWGDRWLEGHEGPCWAEGAALYLDLMVSAQVVATQARTIVKTHETVCWLTDCKSYCN